MYSMVDCYADMGQIGQEVSTTKFILIFLLNKDFIREQFPIFLELLVCILYQTIVQIRVYTIVQHPGFSSY